MLRSLSWLLLLGCWAAPAIAAPPGDPDLPAASQALLEAIQKGAPLKGLMSPQVVVTYHTDDRSTGAFDGEKTIKAAEVDGPVAITGKQGGEAWATGKKIKPRPRTVKLSLLKETREILKLIAAYNRGSSDPASHMKPTLDAKKLTYEIAYIAPRVKFFFKREGKALLVHKIEYAVEDPG